MSWIFLDGNLYYSPIKTYGFSISQIFEKMSEPHKDIKGIYDRLGNCPLYWYKGHVIFGGHVRYRDRLCIDMDFIDFIPLVEKIVVDDNTQFDSYRVVVNKNINHEAIIELIKSSQSVVFRPYSEWKYEHGFYAVGLTPEQIMQYEMSM